jgi:streptogramin lyase
VFGIIPYAPGTSHGAGGEFATFTADLGANDVVYSSYYKEFFFDLEGAGGSSMDAFDPATVGFTYGWWQFSLPSGDSARNIFVDQSGVPWVAIGQTSATTTTFQGLEASTAVYPIEPASYDPYGLTQDSQGNFWVTEPAAHQVQMLKSGVYYSATPASGAFSSPMGISEGADGNVYVADAGNGTIWSISETTLKATAVATVPSCAPHDIKPGINNDLWVTEYGCNAIGHLSLSASHPFTSYTNTAGAHGTPERLTVDAYGHVWFTDTTLRKIFQYVP